jgi:excisionase family DNA binding protein
MPPDPTPLDVDLLAERIVDRLLDRLATLTAKRYLSVSEAASYSSLSTDTIRALLAARKLTALHPVKGRVLVDKRELDALVLSSTRQPRQGRGRYPRPMPEATSDAG